MVITLPQELLVWLRKGVHWSAAEREYFFPRIFVVNFVKCLRKEEETTMRDVHSGPGVSGATFCLFCLASCFLLCRMDLSLIPFKHLI